MSLFAINNVFAQDQKKTWTPEQKAEKMTSKLVEKLELNDKQKAEIYQINLATANRMKVVRDGNLEPEAKRAEMKSLRQNADKQINAVLTKDQQAKYAAMKEEMKEKHKNHRGGKMKHKGEKGEHGEKHHQNKDSK